MNKPTYIIVHCSASAWGDAKIIDEWHRQRGFSKIGYHYVILNGYRTYAQLKGNQIQPFDDGRIEDGRPEDAIGAHCIGYNDRSIGVCLIGDNGKFSIKQISSLVGQCLHLMAKYHIDVDHILGHCETMSGKQAKKTCPTINMDEFRNHFK